MIMRIILILIIGGCILLGACQDITPGYLQTEYAGYTMDSMVVKKFHFAHNTPEYCVQNGIYPTIGGDEYKRDKYGWPWTSTPIEGVEGTRPIFVSIKSITTESGDAEKMWEVLNVSGDGTFSMPVYSDVPVGRYQISLTFTNEGYTQDVNNCFTIIVK